MSTLPPELLDANWIKGYEFEKFVVSKFDRSYFSLFFWNGDKQVNGIYPVTSCNPDLEFDYHDSSGPILFAVECKWRGGFVENKVEWATHDQIERYKTYERSSGRVVFVVLGIGGEPANPSELFIVPLSKIPRHMEQFTAAFLSQFRRENLQSNFYLHKKAMRLM